MMAGTGLRSAVAKINKRGVLLIFPLSNQKEPASLWSDFYPKTKMRWEWDDTGDSKVSDLWFLREKLSRSRKVVYTKWYRGRATVFSIELFRALLKILNPELLEKSLSFQARAILDTLEEDSPLSTKSLKKAVDLKGRENERVFNAAMKELWSSLLVVGYGEVDEGAFPSLAIGASRVIFEEIWQEAGELSLKTASETVDRLMPRGTLFRKFLDELLLKSLDKQSALTTGL